MRSVPKSNNELHVTAAGDMWDGELEAFWPAEFVRVLATAAQMGSQRERGASPLWIGSGPLDVSSSELAYLSNTLAGDDPRDFAEGPAGIEAIRLTDGIFFMLCRPAKPWQKLRLLNGFKAAGREPRTVPLVIIASRPRPWPESFEAELLDQFSPWSLSAVVGIDVTTGEGIATACERMLELIAHTRAAPATERPPDGD